jgi:hypothetical protein
MPRFFFEGSARRHRRAIFTFCDLAHVTNALPTVPTCDAGHFSQYFVDGSLFAGRSDLYSFHQQTIDCRKAYQTDSSPGSLS